MKKHERIIEALKKEVATVRIIKDRTKSGTTHEKYWSARLTQAEVCLYIAEHCS